jgi:hypothetical protein
MIVIGVDVHKYSFTAVAVDEVGRMLDERTVPRTQCQAPLTVKRENVASVQNLLHTRTDGS